MLRSNVGKTVFTIDLDRLYILYNMQEPCSVFSAVHFPLDQNVVDTFRYMKKRNSFVRLSVARDVELEYYPLFEGDQTVVTWTVMTWTVVTRTVMTGTVVTPFL